MANRKIKHVAFTYTTPSNDPITGEEITVFRTAFRGETVDLNQENIDRGEKFGAFYSDEELAEQAEDEPARVLERELEGEDEDSFTIDDDTTLEDAEEWIVNEEPTVSEVIAMADNDPDKAQLLLDAENAATGNEPRKGVQDGLTKIIEG